MSDDFTSVFFDEAAEHLQTIEDELLILDGDPDNSEALNAVFRAAHSIKGSAGMFGFVSLSEFTHHLETLLDLIRKGTAELSQARVDLTLQGVDEIRRLVGLLQDGEDNPEPDSELTQSLKHEVDTAKGQDADTAPSEGPDGDDDSFGFFDDAASATDTASDPNSNDAEEDDGFGLFEDVEDTTEASTDSEADDDSFGFFDDDIDTDSNSDSSDRPSRSQSAFGDYFSNLLRDDNEPSSTAPSEPSESTPEPTESTQSTEQSNSTDAPEPIQADTANNTSDPNADPDGQFGWLNRPEKAAKAATDSKPTEKAAPAKPANQKPERAASSGSDKTSGSLRVSLEKVDELVNQISELVITQAMLQETAATLDPVTNERHLTTLETLERNTRELQESVLSIRLLPVSFLFNRFPRVVRDLSRQLGKEVELVMLGEQTELDKSLIEKLSDPLTHLIRNSIDHGIEAPDRREADGKPSQGQVVMTAAHEGGNIIISISDDGAGIDRDKVLAKARDNGMTVDDQWTDEQVFSLIFEPGFSTAAAVTDVSGRGVGMDVVKRNIHQLGGTIDVSSTQGKGSVFTVRLPLTLAITDGMVVRCQDQRYVIPLSNVAESLQLEQDDIFDIQASSRVIRRHGDFLSLHRLSTLIEPYQPQESQTEDLAIVVESDGQQLGLIVDELVGQQQIVIKNLESNYRKVRGFSGATVMGDGSVAFILDVAQLIGDTVTQLDKEQIPMRSQTPSEDHA